MTKKLIQILETIRLKFGALKGCVYPLDGAINSPFDKYADKGDNPSAMEYSFMNDGNYSHREKLFSRKAMS